MNKIYGVLFLVLFSLNIYAERYEVAEWNLANGNVDLALQQFKGLAELGNKDAQYRIAGMYVNGTDVAKDFIEGYAWMRLASTQGNELALTFVEKIAKSLGGERKKIAISRFAELEAIYGDEAFEKRAKPELIAKGGAGFRSQRPRKKANPNYPKYALNRGMSGTVTVEYVVGKDGRTRFHRPVSFTDDVFVGPAMAAARKFVYSPAKIDGQPVDVFAVRNKFIFSMDGGVKQKPLMDSLTNLRETAETGTSIDRYRYAITTRSLKYFLDDKNKAQFDDAFHWNLLAAKDGLPQAKFELGTDILYGEQCRADSSKSHFWLRSAAEEGVAKAQWLLGVERYNGILFDKDQVEGLSWIVKAADNGDVDAKVQYAMLVAIDALSSQEAISTAREYLDSFKQKEFYDKLTYFEVNAALYARQGDFKKAVKWQKKVVKEAKKLQWLTELIKQNSEMVQKENTVTRLI